MNENFGRLKTVEGRNAYWYDANAPGAREGAEQLMASTENSGTQQAFTSGATRSADDHKIDFEGHISFEAMHYFGMYMHTHRVQRDGQVRASDNWAEGIPMHKYVKSLTRHLFDFLRAWRGTITYNPDTGKSQALGELACAILFNVQGLLHEMLKTGLDEMEALPTETRKLIERNEFIAGSSAVITTNTGNLTIRDYGEQ